MEDKSPLFSPPTKRSRGSAHDEKIDERGPVAFAARAFTLAGLRFPVVAMSIAAVLFTVYFYPYPKGSPVDAAVQSYLANYATTAATVISSFEPRISVDGTTHPRCAFLDEDSPDLRRHGGQHPCACRDSRVFDAGLAPNRLRAGHDPRSRHHERRSSLCPLLVGLVRVPPSSTPPGIPCADRFRMRLLPSP